MSFLLKIENIAKSSKILISEEPVFSRSKDRSRTHDQKYFEVFAFIRNVNPMRRGFGI